MQQLEKHIKKGAMTANALRLVLDVSPVGILVFNDAARIIFANQPVKSLFGKEVTEPGKDTCGDFISCANRHSHPLECGHTHSCPLCPLSRAIQTALAADQPDTVQEGEVLLERDPAFEPTWIKFKAQTAIIEGRACVVMAVDDITERKQAEAALREGEQRYREVFNATSEAIFIHDASTGRILDVNLPMLEMYGYAGKEEVLSGTIGDLSAGGQSTYTEEEAQKRIRAALTGNPQQFEWMAKKRSGEIFPVEVTVRRSLIGGMERALVVVRDISERKRAEKEQESLQAQLLQAQKIEAVGRLAGGVAHDFNNLLSIILGYGELVMADLQAGHPHHESLSEILAATGRAKSLARQLLAFSRKQVLEMQAVDLNNVLSGFEKLLRRIIGEDIRLKMKPADRVLPVRVDISQIEQVLMNLAINARDAMPDGGRLTIETAAVNLDKAHAKTNPGVAPGRYAMVAVSDTGSGIDAGVIDFIFEPFFTTKTKDKGTGLGLATSYGIVKQHGGDIWVYSEPGRGSTFKIYLPFCFDKTQTVLPSVDQGKIAADSATILVVEDDLSLRRMACSILIQNGYDVIEADSAAHAVDLARTGGRAIDLVLTDVIMPEMKGPEVYEKIRTYQPKARVLYMSGYTDKVITQQGVLEEGVHFIQKSFGVESLSAKVREVLRKKGGRAERQTMMSDD